MPFAVSFVLCLALLFGAIALFIVAKKRGSSVLRIAGIVCVVLFALALLYCVAALWLIGSIE